MKLMVATFFALSLAACGGAVESSSREPLSTEAAPPATIAADAGAPVLEAPTYNAHLGDELTRDANVDAIVRNTFGCWRGNDDRGLCTLRASDGAEYVNESWICPYNVNGGPITAVGPLGNGNHAEVIPLAPGTCRLVYEEGSNIDVWCCQ